MSADTEVTVVSTQSPQSPHPDTLLHVTALARFEFEPGRGNNGTKIMMVEWQDDEVDRDKSGSWHISWTGKNTVFPADDEPTDNIRRLYFLLPPGANVPPNITIAYQPPNAGGDGSLKMNVNPLPAIFTPELGATAKASGKKGVLHTIWAKKRLQVLEKEIKQEQATNLEGIALEMAVAEKEWIENNFGLIQQPPKPLKLEMGNLQGATPGQPLSPSLQSPRSPGGRRLTEKLKGLSIGTSDKDLAGKIAVNTPTRESHPLSPENGDMAYSSFSAFRDKPLSQQQKSTKKVVAQLPPEHIREQQAQSGSLNFVTSKAAIQEPRIKNNEASGGDGDDLFAVALSPRSPDDPKSPFSIPSSEVGAFSEIKGTQA